MSGTSPFSEFWATCCLGFGFGNCGIFSIMPQPRSSYERDENPLGVPMKRLQVATIGTILVFGAFAGMGMLSPVYAGDSDDPSHFTYARVYCTPDRETHFQNVTVELGQNRIAPPAAPIYVGGNLPASNAYFAGFEPGWGARDLENRLNHPAPAAQFVTVVHGAFSITTTDGETRQFRTGDVIRVDDTLPCKGHITVVGDHPGFLMVTR